jgi:hypothetical protein
LLVYEPHNNRSAFGLFFLLCRRQESPFAFQFEYAVFSEAISLIAGMFGFRISIMHKQNRESRRMILAA